MPEYVLEVRINLPVRVDWDAAKPWLEDRIRELVMDIANQYMIPPTPEMVGVSVDVREVG